jgi:hypothetical protein
MIVQDAYDPTSGISKRIWGPQFVWNSWQNFNIRWWPFDGQRSYKGAIAEFKLKNAQYVKPMLSCEDMRILQQHIREIRSHRKEENKQ